MKTYTNQVISIYLYGDNIRLRRKTTIKWLASTCTATSSGCEDWLRTLAHRLNASCNVCTCTRVVRVSFNYFLLASNQRPLSFIALQEKWGTTAQKRDKLHKTEHPLLHRCTFHDQPLSTTNQPPLSSIIKTHRLTSSVHLARMHENADASKFRGDLWHQKTRVLGLSCGVVCVILRLAVLVELRLVTDGQTQGHG